MSRRFLPGFMAWLLHELVLHFVLALPGLIVLRAVSAGRWPRGAEGEAVGEDGWYAASIAAGVVLWGAVGFGLARVLV